MRPIVLLALPLLVACSTQAALTYAPRSSATAAYGRPAVANIFVADERGFFVDERGQRVQDYAAVMGPDGRPLKGVASPTSVADDVAHAFRTALAARGELAPTGRGRFDLHIAIVELAAEQYAERQGAVDLIVRLIDRKTGREAYSTRVYVESRGHNYLAEDNQFLGSPSALNRVASTDLDQAINEVLDRPGFTFKLS